MSFKQGPGATLPYGFDYTDWLDPGETLVSAVWSPAAENADTTMTITSQQIVGNIAQVWLHGGTPGLWYIFRVLITTSLGKVDERAVHVACEEP